jgi:hypothetical protein
MNWQKVMAKPDWFESYDGMPGPMPKKPKPKPNLQSQKRKLLVHRVSIHKGGVAPSGYTTSIGVGGMSFDHKMT